LIAPSPSSKRALEKFGAPIYVRHEVVHNTFVVNDLKAKGAVFVEELDEVPAGATVIFSAHGVSQAGVPKPRHAAKRFRRHLPAGHQGARRSQQDARQGIRDRDDRPQGSPRSRRHAGSVGRRHASGGNAGRCRQAARRRPRQARLRHPDHAVVDDAARVVDALRVRFPLITGPKKDDICYATQNRQDAVKRWRRNATW